MFKHTYLSINQSINQSIIIYHLSIIYLYLININLTASQAVQWHPFRALVASASRDTTIKLWDPRSVRYPPTHRHTHST